MATRTEAAEQTLVLTPPGESGRARPLVNGQRTLRSSTVVR